ncbi:cytochrome b [Vibrio sp. SCSIO 43136]|uniref:cytochrome b n=1 Tax=Vibrio sp. SCSIO 43136 TaxID=2819101 RepID=UPI00207590C6|nr:cytochrome b [Vibrio sp. SCSIO 43136]USD66753.1 cytochrome b [Vibrio sp. SCSIO 43136]
MAKTHTHYHPVSRAIHWLSAIVVFGMFGVGLWMVDLTYYSEWYKTAPDWHRSVGILLALVTAFRLVWKKLVGSPSIEGNKLEKVAATSVHHIMYLILAVLFVSGYLISTEDGRSIQVFNWFEVPGAGALFANQADIAGEVHFYAAWLLVGLAGLHALAALKHHFIDKDNTLNKMTGAGR